MMQQPTDEHNYLALAALEMRCEGLRKLLEAFKLHCINCPAYFTMAGAQQWIDEGYQLIADAEKVLKEEGRH